MSLLKFIYDVVYHSITDLFTKPVQCVECKKYYYPNTTSYINRNRTTENLCGYSCFVKYIGRTN